MFGVCIHSIVFSQGTNYVQQSTHTFSVPFSDFFTNGYICVMHILIKLQNTPFSSASSFKTLLSSPQAHRKLLFSFLPTITSFACFRTWYKWNHTVCTHISSFTQHHGLKVQPYYLCASECVLYIAG